MKKILFIVLSIIAIVLVLFIYINPMQTNVPHQGDNGSTPEPQHFLLNTTHDYNNGHYTMVIEHLVGKSLPLENTILDIVVGSEQPYHLFGNTTLTFKDYLEQTEFHINNISDGPELCNISILVKFTDSNSDKSVNNGDIIEIYIRKDSNEQIYMNTDSALYIYEKGSEFLNNIVAQSFLFGKEHFNENEPDTPEDLDSESDIIS